MQNRLEAKYGAVARFWSFILSLFLFATPQKYRQNDYVMALNRFYHNVAPLGLKATLACYCYHNFASNEAFLSNVTFCQINLTVQATRCQNTEHRTTNKKTTCNIPSFHQSLFKFRLQNHSFHSCFRVLNHSSKKQLAT